MNIFDEAKKALLIISEVTTYPGDIITTEEISKKLGHDTGSKEGSRIFKYLIDDCLVRDGLVERSSKKSGGIKVTPKGFKYIDELLSKQSDSNKIFCAMSFDNKLDEVFEQCMKPAINKAGYEATRVDREHFNDDINSQIILLINQSKFIVADFTELKGGVYFEAGYAAALKKPVIYTCSKEQWDKEKPHFDVDHYNFIRWDNLIEYQQKLYDRILHTIL